MVNALPAQVRELDATTSNGIKSTLGDT